MPAITTPKLASFIFLYTIGVRLLNNAAALAANGYLFIYSITLASVAFEILGCVHWKSILKEPLFRPYICIGNRLFEKRLLENRFPPYICIGNRLLEKRLFKNRFPVNAAQII